MPVAVPGDGCLEASAPLLVALAHLPRCQVRREGSGDLGAPARWFYRTAERNRC
jgi:hypothetical protein